MKPIWLFGIFNPLALGSLRITFFIAYLNLFRLLQWLRIAAYIGIMFTLLSHIAITVAILVLTTPTSGHSWLSAMTSDGHHRFVHSLIVPPCVIGLIIDLSILVLPLLAVSALQLSKRKKLAVYPMFLTGTL